VSLDPPPRLMETHSSDAEAPGALDEVAFDNPSQVSSDEREKRRLVLS